ncbi:formate dehydrogenase accessory sulfurtransferase FdhD [Kozakia baliensis]|uniref:formate dehydrogenase accessory sulfurtransferase FdhD n=1 Tax=Kozakia baliensis TaxID=153496 RepID=UPI00345C028B
MNELMRAVSVTPLGEPERSVLLNVADEVPVRLTFNGILPHGIMMMTPNHLEDFAFGYCLTEGIICSTEQIRSITITSEDDGVTMDVTITGDAFAPLLKRRPRAQTGHTSCGICGTEDVPDLESIDAPSLPIDYTVSASAIRHALSDLDNWQNLNAATRMVHAAAWADLSGRILLIREDVGRHNALDKLIGARLQDLDLKEKGFCILTSRYSFEMALKTSRANMATVVAISAPTYRAYQLAQKLNQTLVAIARRDRQLVFCGSERIS